MSGALQDLPKFAAWNLFVCTVLDRLMQWTSFKDLCNVRRL